MIISNLLNPIQFFNIQITKIGWIMSYPDNTAYYQLLTIDNIKVHDGHYKVPDDIVQQWGADDSIITNQIVLAEPWNIVLPTPDNI
jgi:hypothetical protein